MKGREERRAFAPSGWGWLIRGVVCALPSGYFAVLGGFSTVGEVAAMILGTLVASVAVARALTAVCRWNADTGEPVARALSLAVAVKVAGIVVGAAVVAAGRAADSTIGLFVLLVLPLGIDFATGSAIVRVVDGTGEPAGMAAIAGADSFGWTLAVTLLQAAAVVGGLIGLAGLIVAGRAGVRLARR